LKILGTSSLVTDLDRRPRDYANSFFSSSLESSDLERILHLAGQNMTQNTIKKIKRTLEDTYQTDEYFLDEIDSILAPYWEELTDEDIAHILIESFQLFDIEEQGFIDKQYLIKNLTTLGEMPLNIKDLQLMFSMINNSKKSSKKFDYHQFVKKLCGLDNNHKQTKKKKRL
jgi:Ca2+-binding EF-hand superfamily protein